MKIEHTVDYKKKRRETYPPLVDQIEALMKGGKELEIMRSKILKVKEAIPKKK